MSVALLAPGQGADLASCASEWYRTSTQVRTRISHAADCVQVPATELLHASGRALRDTSRYQPVITALCVGILREVRSRAGTAQFAAGHSVGELTACVAAGVLTDEAAIHVAARRGQLMAREASRFPGGMISVRCTLADAEHLVAQCPGRPTVSRGYPNDVVIAANNAPDEQVLSGPYEALSALPTTLVRTVLATGGAWHSPAMGGAEDEYASALQTHCRPANGATWVANRTGACVTNDDDATALLAGQLTHRVEWVKTLLTLGAEGVDRFIVIGASRALRSFVYRTLGRDAHVFSIEHPDDLRMLEGVCGA